jgi:hypothetical protein
MNFSQQQIILVVATVIGAWGGFPQAPPRFVELTANPMVQWGLVFVLAYQGGAGKDPMLAALGTALLFAADRAMRML